MGLYKRIYTWKEAGPDEHGKQYRRIYNEEKQKNLQDNTIFNSIDNSNPDNCFGRYNKETKPRKTKSKKRTERSTDTLLRLKS
jgi:hypothetical protein